MYLTQSNILTNNAEKDIIELLLVKVYMKKHNEKIYLKLSLLIDADKE